MCHNRQMGRHTRADKHSITKSQWNRRVFKCRNRQNGVWLRRDVVFLQVRPVRTSLKTSPKRSQFRMHLKGLPRVIRNCFHVKSKRRVKLFKKWTWKEQTDRADSNFQSWVKKVNSRKTDPTFQTQRVIMDRWVVKTADYKWIWQIIQR